MSVASGEWGRGGGLFGSWVRKREGKPTALLHPIGGQSVDEITAGIAGWCGAGAEAGYVGSVWRYADGEIA